MKGQEKFGAKYIRCMYGNKKFKTIILYPYYIPIKEKMCINFCY